ncbi:putative Swi2/Snf2-related ATPase, component of the SWR1 complex [Dioszegia hungarica]|uniref:Swi2/Snf2-related ATPase, component of the SWR1 complex n=1 Tax=Dioszegia hungarica TaxID=4972 RepID=A0AA38H185_9TREE|nr:putative Swi2/Snf2-related ATPase, component of the SWR1 complex [Dioszegia hungarica]KAI9632463.1 putative Swi2/Snf2-related ATPase, component of the SWR1 complex [Dioszegia hungarica]
MSALHSRHADQSKSSASGSLSYESTLIDPISPPISRLKPKYTGDSPQYIPSPVSSPAIGTLKRTPSLIVAAKNQVSTGKDAKARKLAVQHGLQVEQVLRIMSKVGDGEEGRLHAMLKSESTRLKAIAPQAAYSSAIPRTTSASSSATPSHIPTSSPASDFDATPRQSKPKNQSKIYANRTSRPKRRDPDEEDSVEEVSGGSAAESDEMDWSGDEGPKKKRRRVDEVDAEGAALIAFNTEAADVLTGTIACSLDQAAIIIKHRPYTSVDDVRYKLTKARGVSMKLFEQYTEIMEGYVQIDACLNKCEGIANDIASTLSVWRSASMGQDGSVIGTPRADGLNDVKVDVNKVSELLRNETDSRKRKILAQYIKEQPAKLSKGTVLKDYQLLGVNWLNLLFAKKIGCILADEMGLGKTIQVIAFLAHLHAQGNKGPHMIFVPASTLENWIREFEKFAPTIDVQTYYGSQAERAMLRSDLKQRYRAKTLRVVLASYTQMSSHDDLSFFRKKISFETCIYDEGHRLKNCLTKAYIDLLSIKPKWRLLLTGTPLQNNLQELVSILMFIHKDAFSDAEPYLRAIFKSGSQINLLSQQRVSRARTMLTPFVLRRRKAMVLDLPAKIETTRECLMTTTQATLYRETLERSKKVFAEVDVDDLAAMDDEEVVKKVAKGKKAVAKKSSSSSHVLMDLRKAASHPLLFRKKYTDSIVRKIAKECLNTPRWCDANLDYVIEDLEYENVQAFSLDPDAFLEGGKVNAMREIIEKAMKEGKRILLFSQFVMILDILQVALDHLDIRYTRLDGSTKTDERQALVDEFTDDSDITVFLLSTKAGGVGINLTAASVVVIYDQDFNPHNDRQAADRAYRIGQEREVEVIKLITKDSIDEDMLNIGMTKLQLDDAVGGEERTLDGEGKDDSTAKEIKKSLLTTLRNKFEAGGEVPEGIKVEVGMGTPIKGDGKKEVKKARASMPIKEE